MSSSLSPSEHESGRNFSPVIYYGVSGQATNAGGFAPNPSGLTGALLSDEYYLCRWCDETIGENDKNGRPGRMWQLDITARHSQLSSQYGTSWFDSPSVWANYQGWPNIETCYAYYCSSGVEAVTGVGPWSQTSCCDASNNFGSVEKIGPQASGALYSGLLLNPFMLSGSKVTQPTPYVSVAQESIHYGERWGEIQKITLNGQLTAGGLENRGVVGSYDEMLDLEDQLIKNFHAQYQPLVIIEPWEDQNGVLNQTVLLSKDNCKVESINFAQSKHVGIVDYTIELSSYGHTGDSPDWCVIDPEDNFSFSDNGDGTATFTHSVSAKGIKGYATMPLAGPLENNTPEAFNKCSHDPLHNAMGWCQDKAKGWRKSVWPSFVVPQQEPILISKQESRDGVNGVYSLTEEYLYNTLKAKKSSRGGGVWDQIADAVLDNRAININYSWAPEGTKFSCAGQDSSTVSETSKTRAAEGFRHWERVFQQAFPNEWENGFRITFTDIGDESWAGTPFPAQDADFGLYNLASVNSSGTNVGDWRLGELSALGLGGCAQFPEMPKSILGISGGAPGDIFCAPGANVITWMHEQGHSLGLGHDRDDTSLNIMTYAHLSPHKPGVYNTMDSWYPDEDGDGTADPEYNQSIIDHIRSTYGGTPGGLLLGSPASGEPSILRKPVIVVNAANNFDENGDFVSVDLDINIKGGQNFTISDLYDYVNADKYWLPGAVIEDSVSLREMGLYDIAKAHSFNHDRSYFLSRTPTNYSIEEMTNYGADGGYASELNLSATYELADYFDNIIDGNNISYGNEDLAAGFCQRYITVNGQQVCAGCNAIYDYKVDVDTDAVTDITQVNISGPIKVKSFWGRLDNEKNSQELLDWVNAPSRVGLESWLYEKANDVYKNHLNNRCWNLNPKAENVSVDRNPFNGTYEISAAFSDKDWMIDNIKGKPFPDKTPEPDDGEPIIDWGESMLRDLQWRVNVNASMPKFEPAQSYNINGHYLIYDIDLTKREKIDISVEANYPTGKWETQGQAAIIDYVYGNHFYLTYDSSLDGAYATTPVGSPPRYLNSITAPTELGIIRESESLDFESRGRHGRADSSKPVSYKASFTTKPPRSTLAADTTALTTGWCAFCDPYFNATDNSEAGNQSPPSNPLVDTNGNPLKAWQMIRNTADGVISSGPVWYDDAGNRQNIDIPSEIGTDFIQWAASSPTNPAGWDTYEGFRTAEHCYSFYCSNSGQVPDSIGSGAYIDPCCDNYNYTDLAAYTTVSKTYDRREYMYAFNKDEAILKGQYMDSILAADTSAPNIGGPPCRWCSETIGENDKNGYPGRMWQLDITARHSELSSEYGTSWFNSPSVWANFQGWPNIETCYAYYCSSGVEAVTGVGDWSQSSCCDEANS